jgi:hypothetical protein
MSEISSLFDHGSNGVTSVRIRTPFVCASCGNSFFDSHTCPVVFPLTVPVQPVTFQVPVMTIQPGGIYGDV